MKIKILNAGVFRSSDKVAVILHPELEDYIPEVEKFYKGQHSGRKLTWHHLMSNGIVIIYPFFFSTINQTNCFFL
jgi:cullin-5